MLVRHRDIGRRTTSMRSSVSIWPHSHRSRQLNSCWSSSSSQFVNPKWRSSFVNSQKFSVQTWSLSYMPSVHPRSRTPEIPRDRQAAFSLAIVSSSFGLDFEHPKFILLTIAQENGYCSLGRCWIRTVLSNLLYICYFTKICICVVRVLKPQNYFKSCLLVITRI